MDASGGRPVCQYALANLKKNSTKLLLTMCIGLGLAMYGIYVSNRSYTNPNYMPSISMASHWIYDIFGKKILHPSTFLKPCSKAPIRKEFPSFLMRVLIKPIVNYSGVFNGLINTIQILLLKLYCNNMLATNAIIALSATGWLISMVCLIGSFATCKLMCISCLGIQHVVIIYLAMRRRNIIHNLNCPPQNVNSGNEKSCPSFSGSSSKLTRRPLKESR